MLAYVNEENGTVVLNRELYIHNQLEHILSNKEECMEYIEENLDSSFLSEFLFNLVTGKCTSENFEIVLINALMDDFDLHFADYEILDN